MTRRAGPRARPKQIARFQAAVEKRLLELGCRFNRRHGRYSLNTEFGLLTFSLPLLDTHTYSVFMRFEDSIRAAPRVGCGNSGKWNFCYANPGDWRAGMVQFELQHLNLLRVVPFPSPRELVLKARRQVQKYLTQLADGYQPYPEKQPANAYRRIECARLVRDARDRTRFYSEAPPWRRSPPAPTVTM